MTRRAEDVALLVALLFKRSKQTRARISGTTLRRLSRRRYIRTAFVQMLRMHLEDFDLIVIENDRGGFGLIKRTALDGAPAITIKKYLECDLEKLRKKNDDFGHIRKEIEADMKMESEGDE